MKIRVIDLETTGLPDDAVKGICEIGYTDLHMDGRIDGPYSLLVNPQHPIPAITRAIHHISDSDVAGKCTPDYACKVMMEGMEAGDIFAAHNAKFEKAFFAGGNHEWICTMQCSKHLFIDSPSVSNQVLRYHLGVDEDDGFDFDTAMPPHRAGPDTFVTAFILRRMLLKVSADDLINMTTAPVVLKMISFGKHRGMEWAKLPKDYLQWIAFKSDMGADEKHTAKHYLGAL